MSAVARRQEFAADRAIAIAERGLAFLIFLVLPTAIIVFSAKNHEFWRDEAQAVLIARNAPFPEFFGVMHVEGIPFLFHLILKVFTVFFPPVAALLVAGWIGIETMLFGTYRLLLAIAGHRILSLVATLLFGLTYNYAYELGAVIRPYGLSLGLALLSMALFRDALRTGQRSLVVFGAITTALGASSTAHGACICGGALAAFFFCALVRGQLDWRSFLVLFLPLPFFALTAWLALPFPGRFMWPPENTAETLPEAAALAHQALLGSFTPQDWWVAASFGDPSVLNKVARLRGLAPAGIALAGLLALLSRGVRLLSFRALEWFDVLAITIGWVPLAEIVVHHYWGSPRHHLMFSAPAVVVTVGWVLASRWRAPLVLCLLPFFTFEWTMAKFDFKLDAQLPFSDIKAAAAMLAPNAHVVADSYTMTESYLLWRPDVLLRGADQKGRRVPYGIADGDWRTNVPIGPLILEECSEAPDRVYYAGSYPLGGTMLTCMSSLMTKTEATEQYRTAEQSGLWKIDCGCVETMAYPHPAAPAPH